MKKVFETTFAGKMLRVETGKLAQLADGSCTVQYGDTVVLATACRGGIREGIDFFPLLVDYEEKLYASGKIKGSRFIKREGRPSDEAVLVGRMIDRSIRPLFKETERRDVQVTLTTLSYDGENDTDVISIIAASLALHMSAIPWNGPLSAARITRVNDEWILNATVSQREKSEADFVVVGTAGDLVMIEAAAKQLPENLVNEALEKAHKELAALIPFIEQVRAAVGSEKMIDVITLTEEDKALQTKVESKVKTIMDAQASSLFGPGSKEVYAARLEELRSQVEKMLKDDSEVSKEMRTYGMKRFDAFYESAARDFVLNTNVRVDGRALDEVRALSAEVDLLPRTHGSALFQRGETQVLSLTTLGAPGDAQIIDGMEAEFKKRYMHHYNFPGFSVGEVRPNRGAGRREIGHGALAEKAILPVLPEEKDFPYTIRVVSEVLMSNGSSSQASICGSSLSLMAAGVPIQAPVAGVAMGLFVDPLNKDNYRIMTDIQGVEDHVGDMDFKIAGTEKGITAIQLDIKLGGVSLQVCREALHDARKARLHILQTMHGAIEKPRADLSPFAPRIIAMFIDPSKIREVIGTGGKVINSIIERTGVEIDIEDDGSVFITSTNAEGALKAKEIIDNIVREVVAGEIYEGKVVRIMDFGAFVEFLSGKEGMIHISELSWKRTNKVTDVLQVGDTVKFKVIEIDSMGRVNLSMKALMPKPVEEEKPQGQGPSASAPKKPFPPKPGQHGNGPKPGNKPFVSKPYRSKNF